MIKSKKFLWNAGIFMFKAKDMLLAFEKHSPRTISSVQKFFEKGFFDLGFFKLHGDEWKKCKNISIDYAIMEKAKNLSVVPFTKHWSDLGGWNSVWSEFKSDENGIVKSQHSLL